MEQSGWIPDGAEGKGVCEKVEHPRRLQVGEVGVQVEFRADGPFLQELLVELLGRKKGGG